MIQHRTSGESEWPGGRIADYVRDLTSVAIAVISREGRLVDANAGFSILLPDGMVATDLLNVRDLFVTPRLDCLAARRSRRADGTVYSGIFNLGDAEGAMTSLQGKLYALGSDLLLVAEQQVAGLELLRTRVLRLDDELAEQQRKMRYALAEAKRQKLRAEQAVRDLHAFYRKPTPRS